MSAYGLGQTLEQIAELLHDQIGLRPESSARGRLHRCATDAAASRGVPLEGYLSGLRSGGDDLEDLVNRLTVQETAFFRHPDQFEVLARDVLPHLRPPVTIWSAGCANGQEAVSLAIVLDEQRLAGTVVATDLSTAALERTASAIYTPREIGGLSAARRDRYLAQTGAGWQVDAALRRRVVTVRHNLLNPLPAAVRSSQVIFCRNILIYLTPDYTRDFLGRVADAFPVGTPLFLGAAEILWQQTDRFRPVRRDSTFYYRSVAASRLATISSDARPVMAAGPAPRSSPRAPLPPVRERPSLPPALSSSVSTARIGGLSVAAQQLAAAGQRATSAGEHASAVVSFRAWAYLHPDDALAHLHLGLALESAGDPAAARRAYGVALSALHAAEPSEIELANEGYTVGELVRLVEAKLRGVTERDTARAPLTRDGVRQ